MALKFIEAKRPMITPPDSQPTCFNSSPTNDQDSTRRSSNSADQAHRRSIFRASSFTAFHIDKTVGWRIRDFVASCEEKLGPYLKWIFPSFIAVHYFYIIVMVILCSVLIYPVKNMSYIDALFFATGASTQAGLNTIDLNEISLYQQIVIYIICCLTTPIFIHSSLCFLRLYWFERYFDNIRSSSKLNFKMRRAATLMERQKTMDRQKTMESYGNQSGNPRPNRLFDKKFSFSFSLNRTPYSNDHRDKLSKNTKDRDIDHKLDSVSPKDDISSTSSHELQQAMENNCSSDYDHVSPNQSLRSTESSNESANHPHSDEESNHNKGITFATDLPKPARDREEVTPRDMYMSISMLRNQNNDIKVSSSKEHAPALRTSNHFNISSQVEQDSKICRNQEDFDENEGPTLIIRGPAEREIQFAEPNTRKKHKEKNIDVQGLRKPRPDRNRDLRSEAEAVIKQGKYDLVNSEDYGNIGQEPLRNHSTQSRKEERFDGQEFTANALTWEQSRKIFDIQRMKQSIQRRMSSSAVSNGNENVYDGEQITPQSSSLETEEDDSDSNNEDADEEEESVPYALQRTMSTNYLSWVPRVGRNSTFVDLTDQQKEELGGVEYRALKMLVKILLAYYIGFHILAPVFLVPWIWRAPKYREIVNGFSIETSWWGFFTGMSSFNNLGFTLTANSMNSFNTSPYALLISSLFIIIGNTGFPIFLRFIIWVMFKVSRDLSLMKESLGFLLDHPRRCFTLLFPSAPTWWLLFILLVLNIIDLILFIVLDINSVVLRNLSTGFKVLDGLFQAVSTRTAGFACVDLSQLHPSVQVSYMVMMYISVLPIAISIRRTNVYEEQSLGIFAVTSQGHLRRSSTMVDTDEYDSDNDESEQMNATSFIGAHLRKQLSFDLWFIVMGVFIICIAEGNKIQDEKANGFDIWHILFEVVSAYGTVGLSLGFPGTNASFSSQFNVVSKLVIILMMIRGRHRGLPYSLDRAIMLPSKKMERRDMVQGMHNRMDSLDLSQEGHSHTSDTAPSNQNHDPVLQFLKSVTPDPLRKHIRKPSVFRSNSVSNPHNLSRRLSSIGKGNIRPLFTTRTQEQNNFSSSDITADNKKKTIAVNNKVHTANDEHFRDIHFGRNVTDPLTGTTHTDYEMDSLEFPQTLSPVSTIETNDFRLSTYATDPQIHYQQASSPVENQNRLHQMDSAKSV